MPANFPQVDELLSQLVQIPSVNPMGHDAEGDICFEHRMTDHLEGLFQSLGMPSERHTVHPGRQNILARMDAGNDRPVVMLEVHQDTVPVVGMVVPPFRGEVRESRVWGRGACDIKGGMACILAALNRLQQQRPAGLPNIVVACTVNEEHGFTGAKHLAELWGSGQSKLLPAPPDAIIVAEPTQLNVVVAHKGVVRWKCHTHGRAAHSSNPAAGENAIYSMMPVVAALHAYARDVAPTRGEHPLVGKPTLSVGTIHGGISVNTVPDRCTIEIDRRLLPGEDPLQAYREVIDHVTQHSPFAEGVVAHDEPFITALGLRDGHNNQLADGLIRACHAAGHESQRIGVAFGTDASAFGQQVPTVVFGPGNIAQAHTDDEWVAVEQLQRATKVLVQFLSHFC